MSFAGLTAVVTGATGGIGAAVALALAAAGATVHGLGRHPAGPAGLAWHRVDLADDAAVAGFAAALGGEGLDILVHGAGLHGGGTVATTPVAELERQWRVNARAPYLLTQALLPRLVARQGQVVVLNSSIWGNARAGTAAYAGSKYALKAFTDALRAEVNPAGLRVLSVYPGRTATPMQAAVHRAEARRYDPEALLQPEDVAAAILAALALPRTAELTDLHIRPARKS
jgi:NAD(P)-dependent dehydrogenase (short-subunit alcohol dehydrogenase family)